MKSIVEEAPTKLTPAGSGPTGTATRASPSTSVALASGSSVTMLPSSVAFAVTAPLTTGASLVPLIVIVTVWVVPSPAVTVTVSVSVSPTFSPCTVKSTLSSV